MENPLATKLVAYDLSKPGQNYVGLIEYLKSFSSWAHIEQSVWAVVTNMSDADVRDKVATYLDNNDKLIVINITGDTAAWRGLPNDVSDWLKANL